MFRLILLFWVFYLGHPVGVMWAQGSIFEKITIEQGLSQGMIFDILQTRDGFLWVATKDGLNRYDGYKFKIFANNPFDSLSIAGNTATVLFEDSRGWLWVGLEGKGVDVYSPETGYFHHFPLRFGIKKQAPFLRVQTIDEGKDGSIWVLQGSNELVRLEIPAQWRVGLPLVANLGKQTASASVVLEGWDTYKESLVNFLVENDGGITLFSNTRQYRVEPRANTAKPVPGIYWPKLIRNVAHSRGHRQTGQYMLDMEGRLYWLDSKGLLGLQTQKRESQQAHVEPDSRGGTWFLLDSRVWRLGDKPRALDLTKADWTLDRDVTCLESDRKGNIWIGTSGYGLRKINPAMQLFHLGAAGHSIWRLWRTPKGRYYCRKGLIKVFPYDPNTGMLGETVAFPELGDKGKRDICFEPSGAFWVLASPPEAADQGGFLCRYDASETLVQVYPFNFNGYDYSQLLLDRDGYVWATGARCQLVRFDPRNDQFEYFNYAGLFGEQAETIQPFDIAQDGNGVFWIGTQKGLVEGRPNKQKGLDFQLIQTDPNRPQGLNHNAIACLLPDPIHPNERLWIGTKGRGINCLDLRSGQFQHLTMADGFPDNVVYGILPGNENPATGFVSLWCSTNRGLVKLMPKGGAPFDFDIVTYSVAQGLQDNEFNTQAYFKADNGELLFGGVNGLNRFFPEKLFSDTIVPPVFIVGLEINHRPAGGRSTKHPLTVPLERLPELYLDYGENNISVEFATLDFTDPTKNRYRYRLVGLDKDWVETGNYRFAHFSHLTPGRYELLVQGSNGECAWQDADPLKIVVNPPWYRSNIAYLCYILLLVWLSWRAYQFQIRRIKEREQLAFEHRETERVKALEQLKTNFFSNVTHEFRTPLTLIIEPLRQLIQNPDASGRDEKIRLAERNSRQLLALVNQLLDMSKLESGQMTLDLRRGDLGLTVRETFERFLPLAEKRQIKLVLLAYPNDLPVFDFDKGKVELILNNLISNALKFTPEGGRVEIACRDIAEANGDARSGVEISVRDTGIGIAPEHLDKVFDRFYQVDGSHTRSGEGTGIGLALSKELAELMGGRIEVESEVGKGATFRFAIYDLRFTIGALGLAPQVEEAPKFDPSKVTTIPKPDPSRVTKNPKSIALVLEDNAELRQFIKQSIGADWQVVEASNGAEGVEKALELLPDIVISDLMMPMKDGFAVVDELKNNELTAHIPIILLTAKSGIETKLKALRRGADDYLTKPFSTEELLARMTNLVETRRKLRQLLGAQAMELANLPENSPSLANVDDLLSEPDRAFLRRFALLVEEKLDDEQISVEDFAAKMLLSRSQLHRKLEALTGQSAWEFVRNYRLDRAHAMLQNREGRVSEIALRVGFGNEKHFSTVFKERFGVSPSQVKP